MDSILPSNRRDTLHLKNGGRHHHHKPRHDKPRESKPAPWSHDSLIASWVDRPVQLHTSSGIFCGRLIQADKYALVVQSDLEGDPKRIVFKHGLISICEMTEQQYDAVLVEEDENLGPAE
jgi:hypothetical protein